MTRISITTLGGLAIVVGGVEPALPTRKARALLTYLALSPAGSRSREHLAHVFWGRSAEEQARASLRQTLSSLRKSLGTGAVALAADPDLVHLDPDAVSVDAARFKVLAESVDVAGQMEAEKLYGGEFLHGFSLREDAFEQWLAFERQHYQDLAQQCLSALLDSPGIRGDPNNAIRIARKLLALDPLQEEVHQALIELYIEQGRRRDALRQYNECLRLLQTELNAEPGERTTALLKTIQSGGSAPVTRQPAEPAGQPAVSQSIHYATARDGTRIAYAIAGTGPTLVKAANWLNHLNMDWESPIWRHYFRFLTSEHTLVRYDERGNGLSDWDAPTVDFEAFVNDLETVVDAAGLDRFPLFGVSQGCAVSIAYAIRHPEKVASLVLYGGFAQGRNRRGSERDREKQAAYRTLIEHGWANDNPASRQLFTSMFIPGATAEQAEWFNALQKATTSADNAIRMIDTSGDIDVSHLLADVRVPTLVIHARNDEVVPLSQGEMLATMIPDARLVVFESRNHILLEDEPAWPVFCREVREFLAVHRAQARPGRAAESSRKNPAIAVEEFENLAEDSARDYFSKGISRDLVTALSRFRSLSVRSAAPGNPRDDADYLLKGSVLRSDQRVRINAQLVDGLTGELVWAERFDRELSDIFAVQDEVVRRIVSTAGGRLEDHRVARTLAPDHQRFRVYDLILWAQALHYRIQKSANAEAGTLLEKALAMAPDNARGHSLIGAVKLLDYTQSWSDSPDTALTGALEHGRRSVQLDGSDSLAHSRLGETLLHYDRFDEARRHFDRALELNPNDTASLALSAIYYIIEPDFDHALAELDLARKLDPHERTWIPWIRGEALFYSRRFAEALESFQQVTEPINDMRITQAACLGWMDRSEAGRALVEEFLDAAAIEMPCFPGRDIADWKEYFERAATNRNHANLELFLGGIGRCWPA